MREKSLRLAHSDSKGVRGKNLQVGQFLCDHGVYICLLNDTHLESDKVVNFSNHICQRTDRRTRVAGTGIIVRNGREYYAVPLSCLLHLDATVLRIVLINRSVKVVAAYLTPSMPLM